MLYIKNERELEEFRRKLRTWEIERLWEEERGYKPDYELFKKIKENDIKRRQRKGDELEDFVAETLLSEFEGEDYYLIHDLVLKKTTQFDLIIVTNFGIFIIEAKDWKGRFIVKGDKWYKNDYLFEGNNNENPSEQVRRQHRRLKTHLDRIEIPMYSYVFISCEELKTDVLSVKSDINELIKEVRRVIDNNKRAIPPFNTQEVVNEIMRGGETDVYF